MSYGQGFSASSGVSWCLRMHVWARGTPGVEKLAKMGKPRRDRCRLAARRDAATDAEVLSLGTGAADTGAADVRAAM